jgi:GcrA cell cycle regulator
MTIETWTPERVEQLRNFATSGLSSSQIAAEIGVTRNAVIGKLHRLGLAPGRPAGGPARTCPPRARRPRHSPQREFLRLMFAQAPSIASGGAVTQSARVESTRPCSLFELARGTCRWPVDSPDVADLAFCGNESVAGFPYCAGHARMAYRIPARQRA